MASSVIHSVVQLACRLPTPSRSIPTVSSLSTCGGIATSIPLDKSKYGSINDSVQGASLVFYTTYAMFDKLGFKASSKGIQASFGRDPDNDFWSDVFLAAFHVSHSVHVKGPQLVSDFGRVLKVIKALESLFAMLRMFKFSQPSLFFGTGNQTPFISSAVLERVFMDPSMRLTWRTKCNPTATSSSAHNSSHPGPSLWSRSTGGTDQGQWVREPLGKENASWLEKKILGNVKYLCEVSVTHSDLDYTNKKEFAPLYFIRSYPDDKKKVEMSFDLTNYQPQFKGEHSRGPQTASNMAPPPGPPPSLSSHVFQTMFLDRDGSSEKWSKDSCWDGTLDDVHQWQVPYDVCGRFSVRRLALVRPSYSDSHHPDMHEIAVVSGLAAAYRLGAACVFQLTMELVDGGTTEVPRSRLPYPFVQDDTCKRLFRLCLAVSHGCRMVQRVERSDHLRVAGAITVVIKRALRTARLHRVSDRLENWASRRKKPIELIRTTKSECPDVVTNGQERQACTGLLPLSEELDAPFLLKDTYQQHRALDCTASAGVVYPVRLLGSTGFHGCTFTLAFESVVRE
ncbi:hypothetical protein L210DRAFT_3502733 [Boletus edulis BED1]|uniref:Uncharacterized protein n=1 Tax=Boletus edulis BED1 TaxID=1328754 RepID=A0AAD4C079_BOLED|nr:hypothetical protein L210DRAFT_3502733 [Boletus edulis BED1]